VQDTAVQIPLQLSSQRQLLLLLLRQQWCWLPLLLCWR
jgi:hypothetical protein